MLTVTKKKQKSKTRDWPFKLRVDRQLLQAYGMCSKKLRGSGFGVIFCQDGPSQFSKVVKVKIKAGQMTTSGIQFIPDIRILIAILHIAFFSPYCGDKLAQECSSGTRSKH